MKLRLLLPLAAALLVPIGAAGAAQSHEWFPVPPAATAAPVAKPAPTIKSAARAYVRFVGPSNRRVHAINAKWDSISRYDLAAWKAQHRAYYLYSRHWISGVSRIRWPQSMRGIVNSAIRSAALSTSLERSMATTSSFEVMNALQAEENRAHRAWSQAVSVLRANLGLPQVL